MSLHGEPNPITGAGVANATRPQSSDQGRRPLQGGESWGDDPKPGDLRTGRAKRAERPVEARQGWCPAIPSRDPCVGVKGPSSPATAGSVRPMSKHALRRGRSRGRATDWATRHREVSAVLSNSERANAADAGSPVCGVSLYTRRETTQRRVKVPKCELSASEARPEPQTAGR